MNFLQFSFIHHFNTRVYILIKLLRNTVENWQTVSLSTDSSSFVHVPWALRCVSAPPLTPVSSVPLYLLFLTLICSIGPSGIGNLSRQVLRTVHKSSSERRLRGLFFPLSFPFPVNSGYRFYNVFSCC